MDQLGFVSGGITKSAKKAGNGEQLPYLRVANIQENDIDLSDIRLIGVGSSERRRVLLAPGDLLFVEGNGSADQIGRVALWDGSIEPCIHQNHLIKVRFAGVTVARWALTWFLSPHGKRLVRKAASSTSGLHTLSISKIGALPVPVPPVGERKFIMDGAAALFDITQDTRTLIHTSLAQATRLRQSILSAAFSGKLVPQDPQEEPATILVDRLRGRTRVWPEPPHPSWPRCHHTGERPMSSAADLALVNKVWNYAHVLRDAGVSYGEYSRADHVPLVPEDGPGARGRSQ